MSYIQQATTKKTVKVHASTGCSRITLMGGCGEQSFALLKKHEGQMLARENVHKDQYFWNTD